MPEWLKNWKTAAAGLAIIFLGIGYLMGKLTTQEFLTAFALVAGGGLMMAKDANGNGKKP